MINTMSREYVNVECYKCDIVFAVSHDLNKAWRRDKTTFYCPNGHAQSYTKSTADILQEKLNVKEGEVDRLKREIELASKPKRGRPRKTK
jgi:hypothetical protein